MNKSNNKAIIVTLTLWASTAIAQAHANDAPPKKLKEVINTTLTDDKYACCIDSLGGGRIL